MEDVYFELQADINKIQLHEFLHHLIVPEGMLSLEKDVRLLPIYSSVRGLSFTRVFACAYGD